MFRSFAFISGLALASVVGAFACETIEVGPGKPKDGGNGNETGTGEEDGSTETDGATGDDAGTSPKYNPPTNFRRTINCETNPASCGGGLCANRLGPNCSGQSPCRGLVSNLKITTLQDFPMKLRTPRVTAADTACRTLCGAGDNTKYAISVQVLTPENNLPLAIKVPAPWKVSIGEDRYGPIYCLNGGDPTPAYAGSSCVGYYGSGNASFAIVTDDPAAPAVDVIVDTLTIDQWPTQYDGQCPYK